jgi:hypothetical protein
LQNEQRTQYFRDYEKSKCSRQFLKEWKQNRPWLVDTGTDMVCSYCKEQKKMKIALRNISPTGYFERTCKIKNQSEKCTIKFRNMTQQKTAWFVQYKDNREIIVVKRNTSV